jgi:hypothetical protein
VQVSSAAVCRGMTEIWLDRFHASALMVTCCSVLQVVRRDARDLRSAFSGRLLLAATNHPSWADGVARWYSAAEQELVGYLAPQQPSFARCTRQQLRERHRSLRRASGRPNQDPAANANRVPAHSPDAGKG